VEHELLTRFVEKARKLGFATENLIQTKQKNENTSQTIK
jgi:lipocalin